MEDYIIFADLILKKHMKAIIQSVGLPSKVTVKLQLVAYSNKFASSMSFIIQEEKAFLLFLDYLEEHEYPNIGELRDQYENHGSRNPFYKVSWKSWL